MIAFTFVFIIENEYLHAGMKVAIYFMLGHYFPSKNALTAYKVRSHSNGSITNLFK